MSSTPNKNSDDSKFNPSNNDQGQGQSLPVPDVSKKGMGPAGKFKAPGQCVATAPLTFEGLLLKAPVDDKGKPKNPTLMVGVKLDLEAEITVTARVRGDILIGLY
ncbi:putative Superoxide dismutase copper/zinc binding domain-containing protein [Seiridium unicorne]|uniref:Superoxide dismutase copper/zinc binding domain-containing protein n=1 Tax=Seiridium unicorne TaxID=138068 RepID=A0ABR2UGR3_9PEZI